MIRDDKSVLEDKMEKIIEMKRLKKSFCEVEAVNINEMNIYKNDIYGFLGPNGAGKTTTMKLILGIIKQDSGILNFYGQPDIKIGSLIEEPSFYENLTGRENLEVMRQWLGFPKKNIDFTLELVGLNDSKDKLSKYYSLGMKQRLGLALALVNQPDVLVLDEPTNGLDPEGIIEIRNLFKLLNDKYGVTIIISSHQLNEISNLATRIGVIDKGELVFEGTKEDISSMSKTKIRVHQEDKIKLLNILKHLNYNNITDENYSYIDKLSDECVYELLRILIKNKIKVYELSIENKSLETLYIDIITSKGGNRK